MLELIDADNLPVPDTVPLSGTLKFDEGTELKFALGHCDKCILNVIVQSGTVKVYPANTIIGVEIRSDLEIPFYYSELFDLEYAPYLRVVRLEDKNTGKTRRKESSAT